jgi:type I restriction enzyme S subunit
VGKRRLDGTGVPRISRQKADSLGRHYLQAGDIVFARRGVQAAGLSALVEPQHDGWLGGTGIIRLRLPATAVDAVFLSFVLSTERTYDWIRQHAIGATMPNLNEGVVRGVPVTLPPLDEQRRIAAILGALDDKIELNRKMNRTLEQMAQAIFKSWFIDFDGHDPKDMVDSELGLIPRGWEVKSLAEIIDINPRTSLKVGTSATFVEMADLPTSGCSVTGYIKKDVAGGGAKFRLGDTLLARITPCLENGKTALVDFLGNEEAGFGSTEFIVLRPKGEIPAAWTYCLARSPEFRQHAISNMTGSSGRQRVPADCISNFGMAAPDVITLRRFGEVAGPAFDRIKANADQSRTLTTLRDTLLPKLISGEIRVPDAEATIAAAT